MADSCDSLPMKSNTIYRRAVALFVVGVLAVALSACGTTDSAEKKIVFEVTGPETADVTFGIGADQTQANGAKLPWKHETTSAQDPLITVITAQSKGTADIVCKISIDGKEVKTNKSTGEFAVVVCSNG